MLKLSVDGPGFSNIGSGREGGLHVGQNKVIDGNGVNCTSRVCCGVCDKTRNIGIQDDSRSDGYQD